MNLCVQVLEFALYFSLKTLVLNAEIINSPLHCFIIIIIIIIIMWCFIVLIDFFVVAIFFVIIRIVMFADWYSIQYQKGVIPIFPHNFYLFILFLFLFCRLLPFCH
jgi:hypothetical protein